MVCTVLEVKGLTIRFFVNQNHIGYPSFEPVFNDISSSFYGIQ